MIEPSHADTKVVPSITVGVGYDSNPWFGPTPPGARKFDYFTNVTPQVSVRHKGREIEGTFTGGLVSAFYANNSEINYLAANGQFDFKLDRLVQRLDRNLTLSVTDLIYYTPQPPAFINPQAGQSPVFTASAFGSGVQPYRVNTTANTGILQGAYSISPGISMQANYTNTIISFGAISGEPTLGTAFGLTTHSITGGPAFRITPRDTVNLNYAFQSATFSGQGGGTFRTHGGTVTWTRLLTRTLTANLTGGVTYLEPSNFQARNDQSTTIQPNVGGQASDILYTTGASLLWNYGKNTALTLAFSRSIVPNFYIVPVPLVSNVFMVSATRTFTARLSASGNINYALNEDPSGLFSYTSYGGTVIVSYGLTRNLSASANYTYYYFDQAFSGQQFRFDRNLVVLSLTAVWN